ncbi:hypothetical protein BMS3Abin13_01015 [bacterium BMS3Abin13]|nr:hypothetical protein BMS3Abin13_01015 [bacterium BMS3Abin13]
MNNEFQGGFGGFSLKNPHLGRPGPVAVDQDTFFQLPQLPAVRPSRNGGGIGFVDLKAGVQDKMAQPAVIGQDEGP